MDNEKGGKDEAGQRKVGGGGGRVKDKEGR